MLGIERGTAMTLALWEPAHQTQSFLVTYPRHQHQGDACNDIMVHEKRFLTLQLT